MEHKRNGQRQSAVLRITSAASRIPLSGSVNSTLGCILLLTVCFLSALALARVEFGKMSPLGVAFTAAAACAPMLEGRRYTPAAVLTGTILGYASRGSLTALRYSSAAVLAFSAGTIFRDLPYFRKKWFAPACAGLGISATGAIYILSEALTLETAVSFVTETALSMAAAYAYTPVAVLLRDPRKARSERPPNRSKAAVPERRMALAAVCISAVCVSAQTKLFADMVLGRILGLYITLFAAAYGLFFGCTAGFCTGAVLDAALVGMPCLTLIYAGAGIFAGLFKKPGIFWQIIAFTVSHAALMPWIWHDAPLSVLYECFAAGVVFFLTTKALESRNIDFLKESRAFSSVPMPDSALKAQMYRLTAAFAAVGDAVRRRTHKNAMTAPGGMYTLALERVCRGCVREKLCWKKDYGNTRAALNEASEKIKAAGRAVVQDFPPYFSARCAELGEFVNNVNEYLALKESRMRYRQKAENDLRMLCAQYDAVTQVLEEVTDSFENRGEDTDRENHELHQLLAKKGLALNTDVMRIAGRYSVLIRSGAGVSREVLNMAEDISSMLLGRLMRAAPVDSDEGVILRETEAFDVETAAETSKRRGEEENGDSFSIFRTDDGMLYAVMSDGMGSGGGAARESAGLVGMLKGFLESGVSVKAALRLLGPAYTIKNEGENFATCDVLKADLYSGIAEFWKCGAAPTYICPSGGHIVRKISSSSMPVGLPSPEPDAEYSTHKIADGDITVMVTDGISEGEDDWLRALIAQNSFARPGELAKLILGEALERRADDDMSVMVLKFTARR